MRDTVTHRVNERQAVVYHVDDVVFVQTGARISGRVVVERTDKVDAVIKVHLYRQTVTTQLEPVTSKPTLSLCTDLHCWAIARWRNHRSIAQRSTDST